MAIQHERREDHETRDRLEALLISTERLTLSTQALEKTVERHQNWIDKHDSHYQDLKLDLNNTKNLISTWSTKVDAVEVSIKELTAQLSEIMQTGLKIKGGWMLLVMLGSMTMGIASLAKAFGVL
jgi:phosphoribosylformimino-5-aminoimidazole carboxamide ribonucleotide (ProFAR) isomerase